MSSLSGVGRPGVFKPGDFAGRGHQEREGPRRAPGWSIMGAGASARLRGPLQGVSRPLTSLCAGSGIGRDGVVEGRRGIGKEDHLEGAAWGPEGR